MRVRHPNSVEGESVDVDGDSRPVEGGTFTVHADEESWLQRWLDANGYERESVVVSGSSADPTDGPSEDDGDGEADSAETCQAVKSDAEICGRDRPCRYHD